MTFPVLSNLWRNIKVTGLYFLFGIVLSVLLMAVKWHEHGKRSGVYDHRASYEDKQSGGGKNCSWHKKISDVLRIFLLQRSFKRKACRYHLWAVSERLDKSIWEYYNRIEIMG